MKATAVIAPAQAARVVFVEIRPIPSKSIAESVLPGLNPYQPNHRITAPSAARVMLCPGGIPPPSRLNLRPSRGPSAIAPLIAAIPPIVWTTGEPAKSRNGVFIVASHPLGPHTQ